MVKEEIYKDALETFGKPHQIMMLLEEMSELQQAVCKYQRYGDNIQNVYEEIVDVEIMLEQMKMIFEADNSLLNRIKEDKLNRLSGYIKNKI